MENDDAFLYGSDTENKELSESTTTNIDSKATSTEQEITNTETNAIESTAPQEDKEVNEEYDEEEEEEEDDDENSDSDSDVEFIIGSTESKVNNVPATHLKVVDGAVVVASDVETPATSAADSEVPNTIQITTVPILTTSNGLDINKVGIYNDIPITQLSLDELKDKPWRLPGADISDYFNFGFDEISWRAYCAKHENMRVEFNPGKIMTELLASGAMPSTLGQMMPNGNSTNSNVSSMPPPFMMGMPGMPGMPNFMGMPNMGMPNMPNMNIPNIPNMGIPNMSNMPSQNVSTNNSTTSSISNTISSPNIPSIPNIPNLNSRTTSNTPEPVKSKLPHIPSSLRDARDQADKELEKGVNNGNLKFKDRGEKEKVNVKGGSGRRRR
ncbi:cleavage polyadenylation factor subunit fip1 [Pichia californica]|uniref:Pre-mRNA polyadenylation factor FIP1 n=1 Tax=Pichia californica TaxID=460514 RepID=A0A9P6WIU7_9ASCO|nr:cleavage polyadenylation factor subunit fip1 [[Candida] californica]KAG0687746.1 cleavage polyadenylation factor subunit fip1 [[Candida] californica]